MFHYQNETADLNEPDSVPKFQNKSKIIKSSRFILRFLLNERDEDDEADDDEVDDDEEAADDDDDEDFKKFFKFRLHKNRTTKFMRTQAPPPKSSGTFDNSVGINVPVYGGLEYVSGLIKIS